MSNTINMSQDLEKNSMDNIDRESDLSDSLVPEVNDEHSVHPLQEEPLAIAHDEESKIGEEVKRVQSIIEVPDGGYGWFIVIAVFCFNVATWASNSAFAIYLAHYLQYEQFEGASKLDYAAIGGIAFGVGLFCAPIIIYYIGMTGPRTCIITGGIFQFCGILLAAFSTKLWQLYLTQGLLISFGLAFVCIPANILLPQWFRKKRSLAQALSASGSGAGGVMFSLAIQKIIEVKSVKWALIIQAIICASVTVIGCALTRTRNEHVKPTFQFYDKDALKSLGFQITIFWISTTILGYVVILYNISDFTISLGYSGSQGSIASCMISVGVFFGRPTIGQLSDRFGAVTVAIFAHLVVAILCFAMWIPLRNYASTIAFAVLAGGLMGTIWALLGSIVSRVVGLRKLATALGSVWVVVGTFGTVSPLIGIQLRSKPQNGAQYSPEQYQHPAIWCGCCYFAAASSLYVLRAYLLARDEKAEKLNRHMDNGELDIPVTFKDIMTKFFAKSPTRLV